jgi:hypothetical protein
MTRRWLAIAAVTVPGLVLAGVGLTHPTTLSADTAQWWTTMHIVLVPLFPLLAVAVWVLLRSDQSPLGWAGRVAATVYAVFYGVLDALSGIAAGTVMLASGGGGDEVNALFGTGGSFGSVGEWAFLAALVCVLGSSWRSGLRSVPFWIAAVVVLGSGYVFTIRHIYAPYGVAAMLGLAAGFLALELLKQRAEASSRPGTAPPRS